MNKLSVFLKEALLDPFLRSFSRFTETIGVTFVIVILTVISNYFHLQDEFRSLLRALWLLLALLVPATLASERFKLRVLFRYLLMGVALLVTLGYYVSHVFETVTFVDNMRFFSLIVMIMVMSLCIPYFPKREGFATFTMYLASKIFASVFYAGVLYGSLVAIAVAIEGLFSINLGNYIFINLLIIVIGVVLIPIVLGYVPKQDKDLTVADYNKIWKSVFSLILVPMLIIFSLILLIYIVTSSINHAYYPDIFLIATIGVALLGLSALFSLEPFIHESPHLRFFARYWPFAMLANLIGFAVETVRLFVLDGFTMEASFYMYAWIYLSALLVIRVVGPKRFPFSQGQTFLLSSIDILFIITMFPFINIVSISSYQLNADLKATLVAYGMLGNGEIIARTDLGEEEEWTISQAVIAAGEVGYSRIAVLPSGFALTDFETVFGFPLDNEVETPTYVYFSYFMKEPIINLGTLPEFDYLYDIIELPYETVTLGTLTISNDEGRWTFADTGLTLELDFTPIAVEFLAALSSNVDDYPLASLTYSGTTDNNAFSIYFRDFSGYYHESSHTTTNISASFVIGINNL